MSCTEALCILHGRLSNRTGTTVTDKEYDFLEKNNISNIERLISFLPEDCSPTVGIPPRIAKEISDIQTRYNSNNDILLAITQPPYVYRIAANVKYYHWLPLHQSRLLGMSYSNAIIEKTWENILLERYEEFNTLVHVTHIDKAEIIFKENHLQVNPVADNSVFSKIPGHPNQSTKVIWFGPGVKANVAETNSRYGNVAFCMDNLNGTIGLYSTELNYYFVEVIDYYNRSACRILVTTKTYPQLRPYDPAMKGGPWYYDTKTNRHYWLKNVVRYDGTRGRNGNSLEIMREVDTSPGDDFQKNLKTFHIPHPSCIKGRCIYIGKPIFSWPR